MPRVLVVDDDRSIRQALERGLRLEGFDVTAASAGEEASAVADSDNADVVVLGVGSLESTGWRLSAGCGPTATMYLSAYRRVEVDDRVIGAGRSVRTRVDPR